MTRTIKKANVFELTSENILKPLERFQSILRNYNVKYFVSIFFRTLWTNWVLFVSKSNFFTDRSIRNVDKHVAGYFVENVIYFKNREKWNGNDTCVTSLSTVISRNIELELAAKTLAYFQQYSTIFSKLRSISDSNLFFTIASDKWQK